VNERKLNPEDYLKLPYTRILIPDEESGTFTAEIIEFPGCISQADTPEEAYNRLEEAAKSWIEAALDLGQAIPSPSTVQGYGGKFALRLPRSLHRQASLAADRDGTSLNQFIVSAVSEKLGASNFCERLIQEFFNRTELKDYLVKTAVNKAIRIIAETATIEAEADTSEIPSNVFKSNILWGYAYARDKEYRI